MKTILIIGKIGQVGFELRRTIAPLGKVVSVDYPEIDLTDGASIQKWVADTKPAVIINSAAYTAVDKAETDHERCQQINGIAPGILAEQAKKLGALLVHYSTDYVYDGTRTAPYDETAATNPLSVYGRSKLAGDQAILQAGANHLIFRLCWVYGPRGQNFLLTIRRLARERDKLRIVQDQVGCPTWSRLIAEATALALQQVLAAGDPAALNGIYHLAANGQTSWHGFAEAIIALLADSEKKCRVVEPITTSEYPLPARRPAYSVLSCEKLKRTFGLQLPDWRDSLTQVVEGI
jgi:dTDP-4-dehydrorhamnose reductase